jgi:hypothetical protein
MGRWTIVNALLALFVALLGFQIVRTWARGLPPIEVPPPSATPPAAPEPHEKGKRAADKAGAHGPQTAPVLVAAIADKDLFDPSRKAPPPDEVKTTDAPPVTKPPDGVTVVGVRIFGKDREVFVQDASQQPAVGRRLRPGDQVAGYTVKAIEPTGITLTSPSGDLVPLALTIDKGKAGPPGAPGAPRPPVPARPPQAPAMASPAAGVQGSSPAAGVAVKPATPPTPSPPGVAPPPGQPQTQNLPSEVRQKLEQLKQNDKRSGRKH